MIFGGTSFSDISKKHFKEDGMRNLIFPSNSKNIQPEMYFLIKKKVLI